ncbi:hypothetical protein KQH61_04015 [bacterium]|nr:hypothetical protein [bacterium]MCB2179068.1 hypothetical protein [bacterium]
MRKWIIWILILVVVAIGVGLVVVDNTSSCPAPGFPAEVPITTIPLAKPLGGRDAEVSGMDWYGDWLILLPQFLDFADERALYAIHKEDLMAYLDDPIGEALEAVPIPLDDEQIEQSLRGFEGYESIAFSGNQVFLTIETSANRQMQGYLVSGEISPDLQAIVLDTTYLQMIPLPEQIFNLADEAMFVAGEQIITMYEANGSAANANPSVQVFDLHGKSMGALSFPPLEYRVTDATRLDEENNFWVTNQYSIGSFWLSLGEDGIANTYGEGCTHARHLAVERLVEMHYDPQTGISLVDTPPIQIQLAGDLRFRNWEALVRLDDLGFLVATDKYPGTVLAFIPYP